MIDLKELELYHQLKGEPLKKVYAIKVGNFGFLNLIHKWNIIYGCRDLDIEPSINQSSLAGRGNPLDDLLPIVINLNNFEGRYSIHCVFITKPKFTLVEFLTIPTKEYE